MFKKTKTIDSFNTKEHFLNEKLHYLIDDRIALPIKQAYLKNIEVIEFNKAKIELLASNARKGKLIIEKIISLNAAIRHAEDRASQILMYSYHFNKQFKEKLAQFIYGFSTIKNEELIIKFIIESLKKEILQDKYLSKEQVFAAALYFKEQSNNLAVNPNEAAAAIDQVISQNINKKRYKKLITDKSTTIEEGRNIINSLRERNLICKDKVEHFLRTFK